MPAWLSALVVIAVALPVRGEEALVDHVVVQGDDCLSIARERWPGAADALEQLHAINPQLGPTPHNLVPGQRLKVVQPPAQVSFLKPAVRVKQRQHPAWDPARVGQSLFKLDSVSTEREAGALLRFRDASTLRLYENALVVLYAVPGPDVAGAKLGTVRLEHGDLRASLGDLRKSPLTLTSAAATTQALRGEVFVGQDEAKTSRVSVFTGEAKVSAGGRDVVVPESFGTVVLKGKPPTTPTPLPVAPRWPEDAPPLFWLRAGGAVRAELKWDVTPGVARWRVEVANDQGFGETTIARVTTTTELKLRWGDLTEGRHFARVVPVDAQGLWGIASPFRELQVASIVGDRGEWSDASGAWVSAGSTTLQVTGVSPLDVRLDGQKVEGPLSVGVPGDHVLRLALPSRPEVFTEARVRIIVPKASLTLAPGEGRRELVLRLADTSDRPIDVDAGVLQVGGPWRATGAFTRTDSGTYTATVEPLSGAVPSALRVTANGMVVARLTP